MTNLHNYSQGTIIAQKITTGSSLSLELVVSELGNVKIKLLASFQMELESGNACFEDKENSNACI